MPTLDDAFAADSRGRGGSRGIRRRAIRGPGAVRGHDRRAPGAAGRAGDLAVRDRRPCARQGSLDPDSPGRRRTARDPATPCAARAGRSRSGRSPRSSTSRAGSSSGMAAGPRTSPTRARSTDDLREELAGVQGIGPVGRRRHPARRARSVRPIPSIAAPIGSWCATAGSTRSATYDEARDLMVHQAGAAIRRRADRPLRRAWRSWPARFCRAAAPRCDACPLRGLLPEGGPRELEDYSPVRHARSRSGTDAHGRLPPRGPQAGPHVRGDPAQEARLFRQDPGGARGPVQRAGDPVVPFVQQAIARRRRQDRPIRRGGLDQDARARRRAATRSTRWTAAISRPRARSTSGCW